MLKSVSALCLGMMFLLGSILLPLGDFSLMSDLPAMYHAYEKIAAPDDCDVTDFIGDYLLSGKELLGHNQHDSQSSSKSPVQYQHSASFCNYFEPEPYLIATLTNEYAVTYPVKDHHFSLSDFYDEFFRPPLA